MGGGKRGDFGNTYGASLDALSNFLDDKFIAIFNNIIEV